MKAECGKKRLKVIQINISNICIFFLHKITRKGLVFYIISQLAYSLRFLIFFDAGHLFSPLSLSKNYQRTE